MVRSRCTRGRDTRCGDIRILLAQARHAARHEFDRIVDVPIDGEGHEDHHRVLFGLHYGDGHGAGPERLLLDHPILRLVQPDRSVGRLIPRQSRLLIGRRCDGRRGCFCRGRRHRDLRAAGRTELRSGRQFGLALRAARRRHRTHDLSPAFRAELRVLAHHRVALGAVDLLGGLNGLNRRSGLDGRSRFDGPLWLDRLGRLRRCGRRRHRCRRGGRLDVRGRQARDQLLAARLDDLMHQTDARRVVALRDHRRLTRQRHRRTNLDTVEHPDRRLYPLDALVLVRRRDRHAELPHRRRPRLALLHRQFDPNHRRIVHVLLALRLGLIGLESLGVHGHILAALLHAHGGLDHGAPRPAHRRDTGDGHGHLHAVGHGIRPLIARIQREVVGRRRRRGHEDCQSDCQSYRVHDVLP